MRHNRRDDGQLSCRKREMKTMNANTALDGHTTVIKMAERGGVPLNQPHFLWPYAPFLQVFVKKKERKSAINGLRLCIDKLLTWVSGQPRGTATSIHPFVQYAKVTLREISPCQCPTVKRSGVAYSCSYALLLLLSLSFWLRAVNVSL